MRTFVLKLKDFKFKAEIKLILNNKVAWSNQKNVKQIRKSSRYFVLT